MRVTQVKLPGRGTLHGTTIVDSSLQDLKCHRFSRVPYALPPTGTRRWRKPEPLPSSFLYSQSERATDYTKPSFPCPQPSLPGLEPKATDEDCLSLEIWVPLGTPPDGGWPVFFYIHGGFLQFGSNISEDPSDLLSKTDVKCIIVSPGYRLGIFGFLSSHEICDGFGANFGLWDQRLALEWTYENISQFGGNKENITVGGLSAGSYSTFQQLAYDIGPNANKQIIRRVFQWSNGCGVEPKSVSEAQQQFDDLLSVLGIPLSLSAAQKIEVLQSKSSDELLAAVTSMKQKFFRPVLDGDFMCVDLFPRLYNGAFGQRMKDLKIQTMIGDLTQEFHMYKWAHPPNSFESLIDRLSWDYPRDIAVAICSPYKDLPQDGTDWIDIFGRVYADIQIHSTMRGFISSISRDVPLDHIHRYRIDWRTKSVDKTLPPEVGATHGTDLNIWFYGNGSELLSSEKELLQAWLKPVAAFLNGQELHWGTGSISEVRYITAEGNIEIKQDEAWDTKMPLWELTRKVTESRGQPRL